ncbi:MAG: hypothetical protein ACK4MV_15250 [Beijerinckiaceae bacterium]
MPSKAIPVTFHVRAEPRPEFIEARRRRARPYRIVLQAVAITAALGLGVAFVAGAILRAPGATLEAGSAPSSQAAVAPPSFPIWRPRSQAAAPAPARDSAPAGVLSGVDWTPVGSIRKGNPAAFPPVERAPDYAGIRVVAGEQAP